MTAQILIADDDPFDLRLLEELCAAAGYEVVTAADGAEVLTQIARTRPDLLLLDVDMPVHDGFEIMRILKADPDLARIPVVVVTQADDEKGRGRAIELGAEDYVSKPYRVFEIHQRVRNALRLKAAESRAAEIQSGTMRESFVDSLTHAGTATQLTITLDYEFTRAARYGHPLTCVFIELTNYASVVESAGLETGEGLLVQIAGGLRTSIRGIDHLFRSSDSSFTVLLPETTKDGASVVVERVRSRVTDGSLWSVAIKPRPAAVVKSASFPDTNCGTGQELLDAATT